MIDKSGFTHYGWLYGLVPVYVDMTDPECPVVAERHWALSPIATACEYLYAGFLFVASMMIEDFDPLFSIKLTGEIAND